MTDFDMREKARMSLLADDELRGLLSDDDEARIYQRGSLAATKPRPFIVLRFGVVTAAAWRDGPTHRVVELWVHDKFGDYFTIDRIIDLAKKVYHNLTNEENFLEVRFDSVTPDLEDPDLETILRVARFTWTLST